MVTKLKIIYFFFFTILYSYLMTDLSSGGWESYIFSESILSEKHEMSQRKINVIFNPHALDPNINYSDPSCFRYLNVQWITVIGVKIRGEKTIFWNNCAFLWKMEYPDYKTESASVIHGFSFFLQLTVSKPRCWLIKDKNEYIFSFSFSIFFPFSTRKLKRCPKISFFIPFFILFHLNSPYAFWNTEISSNFPFVLSARVKFMRQTKKIELKWNHEEQRIFPFYPIFCSFVCFFFAFPSGAFVRFSVSSSNLLPFFICTYQVPLGIKHKKRRFFFLKISVLFAFGSTQFSLGLMQIPFSYSFSFKFIWWTKIMFFQMKKKNNHFYLHLHRFTFGISVCWYFFYFERRTSQTAKIVEFEIEEEKKPTEFSF